MYMYIHVGNTCTCSYTCSYIHVAIHVTIHVTIHVHVAIHVTYTSGHVYVDCSLNYYL